ncbi:hypothetical protein AVEN_250210-1 [Araneus ventricosus]|uniref:Pre-C2HC domain-containing protein n=1 Tax=Araneus ventricosus TaxID=182803 RepID=A0A4Y2FH65_ARAVE|nr:hypothetical protein AVEN_250210-1 [Araneus ventricosus]
MSPIILQETDEEKDLEILYSGLKGTTGNVPSDPNNSEISTHLKEPRSFHAIAEKIREALSTLNPDVNKVLNLLDQLQANYFAAEIVEVTPIQVNQNSSHMATKAKGISNLAQLGPPTVNQAPHEITNQLHCNTSFSHCSTSVKAPPNPTILLFPTSNSSTTLTELLNEALPPKDFKPTNIKPIRSKGLAISFQSSSDIKTFQAKLDENINLKSSISNKPPTKRSPSLIIYNIPSSSKEEEIQDALMTQLNLASPLNLRFKFKGNSSETTNWVFEASASILNTINLVKKIQMG